MEHTKYSPTSILKIVLGIIFGAWLMMGAPTGWIYDLWAGTGTEQGQTPDQFVSVVHTQADVESAYTQNTPVTTAKEGLIECPLLRLRDSNEAGEHTFKKGIKRTVIIDEYVHIAYPTNPLRGFLLDFLAHGYYNSYYLAPLEDGTYVCVYFDDYLTILPSEELPTGYVRSATPDEQRMIREFGESYEINGMFVLDMYRHGKVNQMLDLAIRAGFGIFILVISSAISKRIRRAVRSKEADGVEQ